MTSSKRFDRVSPDDVRELVALWRKRLSGDHGIGWLRKQGGIGAWYRRLASTPIVALAVADELERDPDHAIEVEHLREFLAAMQLPALERRARLVALELDGPTGWTEAVQFCELSDESALRFDAWIARAQELELGCAPPDPLGVGARVIHASFGAGTIVGRAGDILTIAFTSGEKRIAARFVRSDDAGSE
jgi:hypothetical protein